MILFALYIQAATNIVPNKQLKEDGLTNEIVYKIKKESWAKYYAGSKSSKIPASAVFTEVSNLKCSRRFKNERELGWKRWYDCKFEMNYISEQGKIGSYIGSDSFALSPNRGWTNRLVSAPNTTQ